jgi:hypothetical protein
MDSPTKHSIRERDGFEEVTLANGEISVSVIPALGGKVTSLRNLHSGREWMWRPADFGGYFASPLGTAFQDGTLAGWDECLPTIAPCLCKDRKLPDHGEVWTAACAFDEDDLRRGIIHTSLALPLSPLRLSRRLHLEGSNLVARYLLENTGPDEEAYIWAMHPLFSIEAGDRLELPPEVRTQLPPGNWTETLAPGPPDEALKAFARVDGPISVGIQGIAPGRSLSIAWNGRDHPVLGLWLTRGGWHGHHHLALEPTSSCHDALDEALQDGSAGLLPRKGTKKWSVGINLH